jgi:ADP-heptose:LPS heptosyltransferase
MVDQTPIPNAQIRKVLIIQGRPFGDVLLNTGYLPRLRKALPQARIDFLVQAPYRTVLAGNPFLDSLVSYPKARGMGYLFHKLALFRRVRRARYDLVIDQLGGTGSAQTVMFSGAPFRIGYAGKRHSWVYSHRIAPPQLKSSDDFLYAATQKFTLLKPLGIDPEPYRLWYPIQSASRDYVDGWLAAQEPGPHPPLIISPGGPAIKRRWDSACYAELADLIQSRLANKVVLLWAPQEYPTAEQVKNGCPVTSGWHPPRHLTRQRPC